METVATIILPSVKLNNGIPRFRELQSVILTRAYSVDTTNQTRLLSLRMFRFLAQSLYTASLSPFCGYKDALTHNNMGHGGLLLAAVLLHALGQYVLKRIHNGKPIIVLNELPRLSP